MAERWSVCPHPDCPELVSAAQPCPAHGRRSWSPDRDRARHAREARAAKRAQPWCTYCGRRSQLDYHHLPGGSGIVLCNACHALADPHARLRKA